MRLSEKMMLGRFSVVVLVAILLLLFGCASNGNNSNTLMGALKTDTGKGAVVGSVGGGVLGALIFESNPLAGLLIGAAGGALTGGVVGHFMDERKEDLTKALRPEINAGQAQLEILPDKAILVTMTGQTAFAPGSAVVNEKFIPTVQKIGDVVKTYGKTTITVIGHPDMGGTVEERATLANQRAEAVRILFIGFGVPPILVTASGHPKSDQMDGRVELVIHPLVKS